MKIGVLGGTFNPPHVGHVIVAEQVLEKLGLDKVLFVPAAIPPHKKGLGILDASHRIEMLRCAIRENPHFEISELEIRRGGESYTVDTLRELKAGRPGDTLYLLVGMDLMAEFLSWHEPDQILDLAIVVVLTRPDFDLSKVDPAVQKKITVCEVPEIAVSSSDIRRRVKEGKSIRSLVPAAVESYIEQHQLYR
jgi:nicotinate-nucleotide adenylyltransferase